MPADIPGEPASPGEPLLPGGLPPPAEPEPAASAGPARDTPAAPPREPPAPPTRGAAPAPAGDPGRVRTGRNLTAALIVGLGLGGLAILTLFTVKVTFLGYMAVVVWIALWELSRAVAERHIQLPVIPVAVGGGAALALAYWRGERALVACVTLTVIVIIAWRLPGGSAGYLRDVTAGVFALTYLPLMACFVGLMLAPPDGPRRTLVFLIVTVCSDVGGYFAGIAIGRHPMAPGISPKKTWEGLAGSGAACLAGGAISLPALLHGAVWQGILLGAAVLASAALGDLAESMIKRDLEIKDMGSVLPGHGGVLDRIDSLLVTAPVVWILLFVFVPTAHGVA